MKATDFNIDIWENIPKPDPEVSAFYDKAFANLEKSLKDSYEEVREEERIHDLETARRIMEDQTKYLG